STAPTITSANYDGKKTVTIMGANFGASASVLVNGADLTEFIKTDTDTEIRVKAKAGRLGLHGGTNAIQVKTSGGALSNVFQLTL
ncbi:MAG TPA: IPT/TIG domain-containing protein, partial [Blastocatellia bacterium]|nr:IPT/TIG domain-containing protein [Blastocatellia bacterium]